MSLRDSKKQGGGELTLKIGKKYRLNGEKEPLINNGNSERKRSRPNPLPNILITALLVLGVIAAIILGAIAVSYVVNGNPVTYTTNTVLPSHKRNVYLDGGVTLTLPSDLTRYVGTTYKVCSIGDDQDMVALEGGNSFDENGYWKVVQFESGAPCCIEFTVTSSEQINVFSKTCTLYCADDRLFHCVDPERPSETNAWHGWWELVTKGDVFIFSVPYRGTGKPLIKLDATTVPYTATFWPGITNNVREPTWTDQRELGGTPYEMPLYAFGDGTTLLTDDSENVIDNPNYGTVFNLQTTEMLL